MPEASFSTQPDALAAARQLSDHAFHLLSSARWLDRPSYRRWRRQFRCQRRPPPGRLSFWARLLQAAGLLTTDRLPRPTLLLPAWLMRGPLEQSAGLLAAWVNMPETARTRQVRSNLLRSLRHNPPTGLKPWQRRELSSLRLLGMWQEDDLTPLGRAALSGLPTPAGQTGGAAWTIGLFALQTNPAARADLLWDLEAFLQPYLPGRYLLTHAALRAAAARGDLNELCSILEQGAGHKLPPELRRRILGQPTTRLLRGCVLEFSSPSELARARASPTLAPLLERLLSTRHVLAGEDDIPALLRGLQRLGIPVDASAAPPSLVAPPAGLTQEDYAHLYRLALEHSTHPSVSPGLLDRLAQNVPPAVRRAARRQARGPQPPPAAPPPRAIGAPVPLWRVQELRRLASLEESVTVLYQAAGGQPPRRRHILPLLVEQRGQQYYLLAFCHERRANRTFRLDRMLIEGERAKK